MPAKTLLLLRHAKSSWAEALPDAQRPLAARGEADAPRMAKWLAQTPWVPQRIVCSPATRCRQTLTHFVNELHWPRGDIDIEPRVYEAWGADLLTLAQNHLAESSSLLIVGHNPGLDDLLITLADKAPPRTGAGKLMTTCALAVLSAEGPLEPGCAQLEVLQRPREL